MKALLITIISILPACAFAQQYAAATTLGAESSFDAPGQVKKTNVSVQGSISIPALNSVQATIMNSEQAVFRDWADINNGKTILNYASVTVKSSGNWVLHAKLEQGASGDNNVITYSIREKSQQSFTALTQAPTAVLTALNDNIINTYQFDLKLETDYKRFKPGNYNVNIVFTLTQP